MALKTDYKDDILDVSQNTKRKYTMIENQDGTVSFDDETVYSQEGDSFGASDINAITEAVNSNSGMPVGTIATFDGTTLPSGFEPYQTEEQRAIAQINDNLSGFKFYPTGTGIVGLIADDSAYTDADGKYVIWGTATANQLVEDNPNTYKSVPSTEDLRGEVGADTAVPFSNKKVLNYQHTAFSAGYGATNTVFNISVTKDIKEIYIMFNCAKHNTMSCGALAFSGSAYSSNNIVSSKSASGNTYITSYVYKVLTNGTDGTVTVKLNGGNRDVYTFAIGAFY